MNREPYPADFHDELPSALAGELPKPVIWTVSVTRLSRLLADVAPEFDRRARIEPINLGFEDAVTEIRRRLRSEDCDVLVAAGSNGAYLSSRVDKPIVLVKANGFDLMSALSRARKISDRIGVVTHETELETFEDFQHSFGLSVEQRTFVTAEDARHRVAELVALGVRAIVGTGMVVELAEQAGIDGILLYSADSIRAAFQHALDIALLLRSAEARKRRGPGRGGASADNRHKYSLQHLIGHSPAMRRAQAQIERYADSEATVLIQGDTGTGKELAAHALHAGSRRRNGPFVAVNCGAIAESLLESELFGYEEGAFTGSRRGGRIGLIEAARGGTLFLDEIGEMPLPLQTRLLRVLEEREIVRVGATKPIPVDLRIIAATHMDLGAMVADRRFRADLYYRLNVLRVDLPPLRERDGDVALLAQTFLKNSLGSAAPAWKEDALDLLGQHDWPGNVRELRNIIDRLAVISANRKAPIDAETLLGCAPELGHPIVTALSSAPAAAGTDFDSLASFTRRPSAQALADALARAGGNRGKAAELLGVSRATLWRWLQKKDSPLPFMGEGGPKGRERASNTEKALSSAPLLASGRRGRLSVDPNRKCAGAFSVQVVTTPA